jgi:hypothetical protein
MGGGVSATVPQAFGVWAAAVGATLLVGATWAMRGPICAAVAGAGLLVLPPFLRAAASQLADVPLACCYLATVIALALGARGEPGRWFAVAGLSAGAALWTKNEGLLFFVCALAVLLAMPGWSGPERRDTGRRLGEFAAGAMPFLIAALAVRSIAVQNELFAGQSAVATWERLTTGARYGEILRHGAVLSMRMPDVIGATGFAAFLGLSGLARDLRPAAPVIGTLALTASGYFALYVVTPYELSWHLDTSADRLIVHLWPSAVFAALLFIRAGQPVGRNT